MKLNRNRIFRDREGRIVIIQWPNLLLWGWIFSKVASILLGSGQVKTGVELLGTSLLFAWAYFEATEGVNYFRRVFGIGVLAFIVVGFFS